MKNFLIACLLALLLAAPAAAQTERIRSFDSRITVNPDGSMLVNETIHVLSAEVDIVHGIYRDFPTQYRDRAGNRYSVLFDIVSLRRDGDVEPDHAEDLSNGVRVYFGSAGYDLPPGPHAYQFSYRTNRQLGFFKDHDELYWNVTGNGWKFPIDAATATVLLPANARNLVTGLTAYTGFEGEKGQSYTAARDDDQQPYLPRGKPRSRTGDFDCGHLAQGPDSRTHGRAETSMVHRRQQINHHRLRWLDRRIPLLRDDLGHGGQGSRARDYRPSL